MGEDSPKQGLVYGRISLEDLRVGKINMEIKKDRNPLDIRRVFILINNKKRNTFKCIPLRVEILSW